MPKTTIGSIFRSGDLMLSTLTNAPSGWTDVSATYNNKFLRISSGTPLSTGGNDNHTHNGGGLTAASHALTINEMPSHHHYGFGEFSPWIFGTAGSPNNEGSNGGIDYNNYLYNTSNTGGNAGHTHSITGTSAAASNVPAYVQIRIFKKD